MKIKAVRIVPLNTKRSGVPRYRLVGVPIALGLCFSGSVSAALSPQDHAQLTGDLNALSVDWVQPAVDSANAIFTKPVYTASDWRDFFSDYFHINQRPFTDPLWNYLIYPVFWWFDDAVHAKLQTGLSAALWNRTNGLMAAHAANLGAAMAADVNLRVSLFNSQRILAQIAHMGSVDGATRAANLSEYKNLISAYLQWLHAASTINQVAQPYAATLRAQIWMGLRDATALTPAGKSDVATTLGLTGGYLDIWNAYSVLIHDNNGFDTAQKNTIYNLLSVVPSSMHNLGNITQYDWLGNLGATARPLYISSGVNIANMRVGAVAENSFPSDIAPALIDQFTAVLAHEVNHVVDAFYVERGAARKARKDQLLAQAGPVALQYLRSMFGDTIFQEFPQEFIASIANQWFTDSAHTVALGLQRFDQGYGEPINQALFFAELYSLGGSTTRFFRTDTAAAITARQVPIDRNANGRIVGVTVDDRHYAFTLDAPGNVTAYQAVPVSELAVIVSPTVFPFSGGGAWVWHWIGVTNWGPAAAHAVTMSETIMSTGSALLYDGYVTTPPDWSCAISGNQLNCERLGPQPVNHTDWIGQWIYIAPGNAGAQITGSAVVAHPGLDPYPSNDVSSATVGVP